MKQTSLAVLVNMTRLNVATLDPPRVVAQLAWLIGNGGARRTGWRIDVDERHGVITLTPPEKETLDA